MFVKKYCLPQNISCIFSAFTILSVLLITFSCTLFYPPQYYDSLVNYNKTSGSDGPAGPSIPTNLNWTAYAMPASDYWTSIIYANGTFVALAGYQSFPSANSATSPDGINWTAHTMPASLGWSGIAYGNGRFVAVAYNSGTVAYSSDGSSWSSGSIPSHNWKAIAYGGGVFVAVSGDPSSQVGYSTDGISWSMQGTIPSLYWAEIAYGNGTFVAAPWSGGTAVTSTDGINWTSHALPSSANWNGIAFGNGVFVLVAGNTSAAAVSSDNGVTWTTVTLPSAVPNWYGITYGEGIFVLVGGGDSIAAISPDGINWTATTLPLSLSWCCIAYANGIFAALASDPTNTMAVGQ